MNLDRNKFKRLYFLFLIAEIVVYYVSYALLFSLNSKSWKSFHTDT